MVLFFYCITVYPWNAHDLSRTQDHAPAVCSTDSTVVIPLTWDFTESGVRKQSNRKTNIDDNQCHQLAVLAWTGFCTKNNKGKKEYRRKSWLRRWYWCCKNIQQPSCWRFLICFFLIGYCGNRKYHLLCVQHEHQGKMCISQ